MHRSLLIAALLASGAARANRLDDLGPYERQSVDAALKELGLDFDGAPEGKRLGRIIVRNFEVFGDEDGAFLQWFNWFHRVTGEDIVSREILLSPGDSWDAAALDESIRNLRSPTHSNVVAILPVKGQVAGTFDLLAVTRDVWSLRFNSDVQYQGDALTLLSLSLAENNFLGWRKQLAVFFNMDQGTFEVGPTYTDPNIAGTHLRLETRASALFGRESGEAEGSRSTTSLEYPLWSLSQRFGGEVSVSHYDSVVRLYQGGEVRTYDAPGTSGDDAIPWQYHTTYVQGALRGKASFGRALKQDVTVGYEAYTTESRTSDDFDVGGVAARQFRRSALPRTEVSSAVAVTYQMYTPTYATFRDFATYDFREDFLVGPLLSYTVTQALEALGSDYTYTKLSASFQVALAPAGFYLQGWTSWGARLQEEEMLDHRGAVGFYGATPMMGRAVRLLLRWDLQASLSGETVGNYSLGGDNGLRGHAVGSQTGPVRLRLNLEARSIPWRIWALRIGGVLFWDMGGTADFAENIEPVHDLGLGIRILIPQINTYVFRVDWAFATEGAGAGWPGRVSFGFLQAF